MQLSGKAVILGIVSVALAAAGTSWWFRYSATHRAAQFWGPVRSQLIRRAPVVKLLRLNTSADSQTALGKEIGALDITADVEITNAPGVLHLRNALLEDRSFHWPAKAAVSQVKQWQWALVFHDPSRHQMATLLFSPDWTLVTYQPGEQILSCAPISEGLATMLTEHISKMPPVR
jgi:hypothetical protein